MVPQGSSNRSLVRLGITSQQRDGGDNHAIDTVAALGGVVRYKRDLNGMGALWSSEPFQCGDRPVSDRARRHRTRANRGIADENGTGSALAKATAIFGTIQAEIVSQHEEKRRRRRGGDLDIQSVDA